MKREEHDTKSFLQRAEEVANGKGLMKKNPQPFCRYRNNLQLLEKTFTSLREAVFILDAKTTRILNCNPAASQIFGYRKEEMLGQTANFLHVDEERLEEFRKILFPAIEERGCLDLPEFQMKRRNGEVFFTNHTVMPLEDDQGKRIGWVSVVCDITERKRVEEELRKTREEYRHLVEGSGSVILRVDKDMRITFINQFGLQFFGYSSAEIVGKRALGTIVPERDAEGRDTAGMAEDLIRNPEKYTTNFHQNMCKDGRLVWMSWANKPIYDDEGRLVEILSIGNDLSKLKDAEQALRESEILMSAVLAGASDPIYVKDREGRILLANPALANLTGKPLKEILGKKDSEYCADNALAQALHENDLRVINSGKKQTIEEKVSTPKGYRTFLSSKAPLRNASGKIVGIIGISRDITERKKIEEDLLYRAEIGEVASDALYATDANFNILLWNKSAEHLYGWDAEDVIGKHPRDLLHPRFMTGQSRDEVFEEVRWKGKWRGEVINLRKNGSQITVIATINAIRDVSGNIVGFAFSHTDITDRKRMEEELRRSRDDLEMRVRERTAQLQESENRLRELASELINAQESERKRISHELHDSLAAQLAAIKYRLERKRKGGESPDNPVTLDEIIEDVHNANVETRRIMANLRPSVLDDLGILPAFSWFSRETEKAYPGTIIEVPTGIEEREVPEKLKIVLFRVVQESVTNAIRHGKANRIQVNLERKDPWLRLRVDDNGNGFDSIKLGEKSENGGIGLDSMQQRVDSTGGIFSISSPPGQGTTVKAEWKIA